MNSLLVLKGEFDLKFNFLKSGKLRLSDKK